MAGVCTLRSAATIAFAWAIVARTGEDCLG
jgi:hypothetical protein